VLHASSLTSRASWWSQNREQYPKLSSKKESKIIFCQKFLENIIFSQDILGLIVETLFFLRDQKLMKSATGMPTQSTLSTPNLEFPSEMTCQHPSSVRIDSTPKSSYRSLHPHNPFSFLPITLPQMPN
jgi:hypothetical protein